MAKDPAFLFYSKDWLTGTSEMLPDEKGVYIDLLCYQHLNGDLPKDTRRLAKIIGLALPDFEKIWENLQEKFKETSPGRLSNNRLNQVTNDRATIAKKNLIIGSFAALCRKSNLSKKDYLLLKSSFKVDEFMSLPTERLTERLTEWYVKRLKSIENGNGNENGNENGNRKGGAGGKTKPEPVQELINSFPFSVEFINHWQKWIDYKRDEHGFKYKKISTEQTAFNELVKLSGSNETRAQEIIDHSIANRWKGFYQKQKINGNNSNSNGTGGKTFGRLSEGSIRNVLSRPPLTVDRGKGNN